MTNRRSKEHKSAVRAFRPVGTPEVRLWTTGGRLAADVRFGTSALADLLQFLTGWLSHDPGCLGAFLEEFVGNPT